MREERSDELTQSDRERHQALLTRLDHYADLLDSRFEIPGTRVRIGLDGIIGLIPGVGDIISMGLSLHILLEAKRIGAPASLLHRIGMNIATDFLVGLVPIAGDVLDFAFKANIRNIELLRNYTRTHLKPAEPSQRRGLGHWFIAGAVLLLGAALLVSYW